MEWIKEIPDFRKYLNDNFNTLIDIVGIDKFLEIYSYFQKTGIYFGTEPIQSLQKKYIELNISNEEIDSIARKIGVSRTFVYKVKNSLSHDADTIDMFENND